jgi:hypothetical protein
MARQVYEHITDDLDGSDDAQTVRIGWQGEWREIDLGEKNLVAFSKSFDRFWEAGRRVRPGESVARSRNGSRTLRDRDPKVIRVWAQVNGIAVPARGRIPASVEEQYLNAGGR